MKLLLSVRWDLSVRCREYSRQIFGADIFVPNGGVLGKNQTDQQGVSQYTRACA